MKANLLHRSMFLVSIMACAAPARAEWVVHGKTNFGDEVRAWASPKEAGMNFRWTGGKNSRNEAEGQGVLTWFKVEQPFRQVKSFVYTGELRAGQRDGVGTCLYKSGAKYSGAWKRNAREGKGEYWFSNGDYYVGSFKDNLMHGPGRYTSADGKVFEGTFVADERNGPGVLTYPDGTRYDSTWAAGKDMEPGGPPAPANPYLRVGADVRQYALEGKVFKNPEANGDDFYLTYRDRWVDGELSLEPEWEYWVDWAKKKHVTASDEEFGFFNVGVHPVYLDIRLFNPSRGRLEVAKAEVLVEESYPDLEPILRLQKGGLDGAIQCEIVNFNSGPVAECEIAFNILPAKGTPTFDKFAFVEKLPPFSKKTTWSLDRAMTSLGFDVSKIVSPKGRATDSIISDRTADRDKARKAFEKFPQFVDLWDGNYFTAYALIAGEVRVGWDDHLGVRQTKRVRFHYRQVLASFGPELSVPDAASGKYEARFRTAGKNYALPFAYKRKLSPGTSDRITLAVASEASTFQTFQIRLTTTEGKEILSPRCRLHYLVPHNFSWKSGLVIEDR